MNKVINTYFGQMNQTQYYRMTNDCKEKMSYMEQAESGENQIKNNQKIHDEKEKKIYSQDWKGSYTRSQLDYLDSYYADSCGDFQIVTRSHKDYVKKIAKASLAMDEAFNEMMQGVSGADKRYKESKAIFDSLSQSAKLSEKTRSANDVAGLGSLSEIVLKLETTGFLQKKITFEDDDIDRINADLRWVLSSTGGDA